MKNEKNKVLLIGAGYMAFEYLKVLNKLNYDVTLVSRSEGKISELKIEFPNVSYFSNGLKDFLINNKNLPEFAINTVNVENLKDITLLLIKAGIKNILIEKPGDLFIEGLLEIKNVSDKFSSNVLIAYNRRFYSSVNELQKQTKMDGGILSAHFEFTEWIHTIDPELYEKETLKYWIIANSSHVIDTVFNLIGIPKSINCTVSGQNAISWHPSGSIFIGSGISIKDIPFTYHTNWQSPGRWCIEIMTNKRRFYLKPMETLQIQNIGSVAVEPVLVDNHLDKEFKPGLYLQTEAFIKGDFSKFCTIQEQKEMIENFYNKMSGYADN